jgi:hypothetical protein
MRINVQFLVISYFVSLFVDWILQWECQAINKGKWIKGNYLNAIGALVSHSYVYAFFTLTILVLLRVIVTDFQVSTVSLTLFISHVIIDTRIPVKLIMRFKGMSWDQINDYNTYGFMHINIDQRLHEFVLFILSYIV